MNDDDLNFLLELDVDSTNVTKATKEVADAIDRAGRTVGAKYADAMVAGMSTAGKEARKVAEAQAKSAETMQKLADFSKGALAMDVKTISLHTERNELAKQHLQTMQDIRDAMNPADIEQSVRHERELLEARQKYNEAVDKEHRKQERPGFFQKAFQSPGKAMGEMGGNVKKFFGNLGSEMKEGGFGGLLDSIFRTKKGGAGGGGGGGGRSSTDILLGGIMGGQGGGGALGQAGGMVGEVLGGPAGAMVGAQVGEMVQKTLGVIGSMYAIPAKIVTASLQAVAHGLKELEGPLGPIGAGLDVLSSGMNTFADAVGSVPIIGDLFGPMLKQFAMMPGLIKDITETLTRMAGVASPTALKLFQFAVEDVQGVIGRSFVPVLGIMRDSVRLFGDILASILPSTQEVSGALSSMRSGFAEYGNALRELYSVVGPYLREGILATLRTLGNVLAAVARAAALAARATAQFLRPLMALLGVHPNFGVSTGAAAREGNMQDFASYQRELQLSAFREPGQTAPEEVPNLIGGISNTLQDIARFLLRLTPQAIGLEVANAIRSLNPAAPAVNAVGFGLGQWVGNILNPPPAP